MNDLKMELRQYLSNPKVRSVIYIVIGLFVLVGIGVTLFLGTNKSIPKVISEEEQKLVIKEVIRNNSSDVVQEIISPVPEIQTPQIVKELGVPSQTPDLTKYNYRENVTKYTKGPAYGLCSFQTSYESGCGGGGPGSGASYFTGDNYTRTSVEYFEANKTLSKSYSRDQDTQLFSFTLSEYSNVKSENYIYRGGSYAILTKFDPYPGFNQMSELDVPTSYTQNYYTNEEVYKFIGETMINGQEHYIVETSYSQFCDGNIRLSNATENAPNIIKIINLFYINKQTYDLSREENYLNEVRPENLISKNERSTTTKLVRYSDISDEFRFDYDTEIRVSDYKNYWELLDQTSINNYNKTYLASRDINLLLLDGFITGVPTINDAIPEVPNSKYYLDRAFYPMGSEGDKAFESSLKSQQKYPQEISMYFNRNVMNYDGSSYYYTSINYYSPGVTISELIEDQLSRGHTSNRREESVLKINGTNINLTKLIVKFEYLQLPYNTSSYPISYFETYNYENVKYFFELNGRVYEMSTNFDVNNLNFRIYRSSVPTELDAFFSQLKLGNYYYYYPDSYASYPLSYPY